MMFLRYIVKFMMNITIIYACIKKKTPNRKKADQVDKVGPKSKKTLKIIMEVIVIFTIWMVG